MNLISVKKTMKSIYKPVEYLLIIMLLSIVGCDKTDEIDPVQERKDLLSASSWSVSEVSQSGSDISEAFTGATITFLANGEYTTTIDPIFNDIWPASGSWSLLSLELIMVNGVEMTLSNVSASSLTLSYTAPNPGGRISGLGGDYIMKLR